jgi:hypothetical protein
MIHEYALPDSVGYTPPITVPDSFDYTPPITGRFIQTGAKRGLETIWRPLLRGIIPQLRARQMPVTRRREGERDM